MFDSWESRDDVTREILDVYIKTVINCVKCSDPWYTTWVKRDPYSFTVLFHALVFLCYMFEINVFYHLIFLVFIKYLVIDHHNSLFSFLLSYFINKHTFCISTSLGWCTTHWSKMTPTVCIQYETPTIHFTQLLLHIWLTSSYIISLILQSISCEKGKYVQY